MKKKPQFINKKMKLIIFPRNTFKTVPSYIKIFLTSINKIFINTIYNVCKNI